VRWNANEATHSLAKEGCDSKSCKVWLGVVPDIILNIIVTEGRI
jgi:hypothetical protein